MCPYCYKKKRNVKAITAAAVFLLIGLALFTYAVILPLAGVIPVSLYDYFATNEVTLFGFCKTYTWSNPLLYIGILSIPFIVIPIVTATALISENPEKWTVGDISRRRLFSALRSERGTGSELLFMVPSEAYSKGLVKGDNKNK